MAEKMSPCCARRQAKLHMDEGNLRRIARRAALAPESKHWHAKIATAKEHIAEAKRSIVDHEADHAEGRVAV